ncbi:hypothetical protein ACB094_08G114400 [Castanea mollissima]
MGTLWLPFDNFNSCSTSSKPSICPRISWMDTLNFLFGNCSSGDNLFMQFNLSDVLEHHAQLGCRHLRFRDMAEDILGELYAMALLQTIYLLSSPNGTMMLYEFVITFGCLMLILAQMPSFHPLRHINLISLVLCLSYYACTVAASIYIGNSSNGPKKDPSLSTDTQSRIFGIFNAIAICAITYGNGMIPEI